MSRVAYYLPREIVTPDELIAFLTIITAKAILSEYKLILNIMILDDALTRQKVSSLCCLLH